MLALVCEGYGTVFVGRHYAHTIGVEIYEYEDGGNVGGEETEELAGLDVGVTFCLEGF